MDEYELAIESATRDVTGLVLPRIGAVVQVEGVPGTALLDASGAPVAEVSDFFASMLASGASVSSLRSYGLALLRWWRFLAAVDVTWQRASRVEARDFVLWMRMVGPADRQGGYAPGVPRRPRSSAPTSTGTRLRGLACATPWLGWSSDPAGHGTSRGAGHRRCVNHLDVRRDTVRPRLGGVAGVAKTSGCTGFAGTPDIGKQGPGVGARDRTLNHPGFDGDSVHWIPTGWLGSCW